MMDVAKSETFGNFTILIEALLFSQANKVYCK